MRAEPGAAADRGRIIGFWDFKLTYAAPAAELGRSAAERNVAVNFVKDHPVSVDYATQSGKLIQNFGVIELTSYRWIGFLSKSDIAVEIAKEVALSKRIDIIVKLLGRDDQKLAKKDEAIRLWKQVRDKGCEVRNSIAHGTVGLLFTGNPASEAPQTSGVLRVKKWADTDELISLDEVKDAVNTTAKIAEQLNQILDAEGGE